MHLQATADFFDCVGAVGTGVDLLMIHRLRTVAGCFKQWTKQIIPSFIEFDSLIEVSLMLNVVIRCLASGIDSRGASWVQRCHCARTSVRGN